MKTLEERIQEKLKPYSSVQYERKVIKTVSEVSRVNLNKQLEPKILQNKIERQQSEIQASTDDSLYK